MAVLPNHPQVIVTPFATHDEVRVADGYGFSSATMALVMGDHAGTHVDAPKHFNADAKALPIDQVPLEKFFTEAVCLDLSHKRLQIRHLDRGSAEGRAGGPRHHQAERHRAAAHGFLSPHAWYAASLPTFPA